MNRRDFVKTGSAAILGSLYLNALGTSSLSIPNLGVIKYPGYRGFNLPDKTNARNPQEQYREEDFEIMVDLGFDFARIPLSYWNWASKDDWYTINEKVLKTIDEVVDFGKKYNVHINLNLHRIPGYCINDRDQEPVDLFDDTPENMQKALDAAIFHWKLFARRYKGIPNDKLSFDLINEPPQMEDETRYIEIVRSLINGIREEDPERLIVADGKNVGRDPVMGLAGMGIIQSTRGYDPVSVSHFKAAWVPKNAFQTFAVPTWPLTGDNGKIWDKAVLKELLIDTWKPLIDKGIQVHVGEWGCYNKTPHDVTLAWMRDLLSLWKDAEWGYALWNLRGPFGILDSERSDVQYESYKGHKLDRKMLELLKEFSY
jgi:endoglucanase